MVAARGLLLAACGATRAALPAGAWRRTCSRWRGGAPKAYQTAGCLPGACAALGCSLRRMGVQPRTDADAACNAQRPQVLHGGEWADAWPCDATSLPSAELLQLLDSEPPSVSRDTDTAPHQPAEGGARVAALRVDFEAARAATAAAHVPAGAVGLGQLLCGFFSFWLDYLDLQRTSSVVSVRHGRLLSLEEKVGTHDRTPSHTRTPSCTPLHPLATLRPLTPLTAPW